MQDRTRRPTGVVSRLAFRVGGLFAAAVLSACSSINPVTVFADPGKYEFYNCDQIAAQRTTWATRDQELKQLMDKSAQGTGGAVVNVIAYQADYATAKDELKVLEATARAKNCPSPKQ